MGLFFSHLAAMAFGAAAGVTVLRALTLPKKQADGVAKVIDKADPAAHLTGADVQAANAALVESVIGKAVPK